MGCGIEEKFKPLVKYFYYLGISKDGMRRILVTRPVLFCVDFENTIVSKVCFGLCEATLGVGASTYKYLNLDL